MPSFALPPRFPTTSTRAFRSYKDPLHATPPNFYTEPDSLRTQSERSVGTSEVLTAEKRLEPIREALRSLDTVQEDWNSYGATVPSDRSINMGWRVLASLREETLIPEKVLPSAEGGVAFIFAPNGKNRAVIESLNSGEDFVLLYDLQGNSKTLEWKGDITKPLLGELRNHLRGLGLAAS